MRDGDLGEQTGACPGEVMQFGLGACLLVSWAGKCWLVALAQISPSAIIKTVLSMLA